MAVQALGDLCIILEDWEGADREFSASAELRQKTLGDSRLTVESYVTLSQFVAFANLLKILSNKGISWPDWQRSHWARHIRMRRWRHSSPRVTSWPEWCRVDKLVHIRFL